MDSCTAIACSRRITGARIRVNDLIAETCHHAKEDTCPYPPKDKKGPIECKK